MTFVLRETVASKRHGRPLWFYRMTGIGPMTTPNVEERAVFETREAAASSPAMRHMLACFTVEEIETRRCPDCGGQGMSPAPPYLVCLTCGGEGWLGL